MGLVVAHRHTLLCAVTALVMAGCASKSAVEEPALEAGQPVMVATQSPSDPGIADKTQGPSPAEAEDDADKPNPCDEEDKEGWLDKSHEWVYETVCVTAMWFDGFFGKGRFDERSGETYGRIGLSGFWDQRDGFDPKLRFRGTFALPALSERASLMIGKGDEQELIDERTTQFDTIPGNFNRIEDDSFLVGLGYTGKRQRGFKLSVGAKIRAPPEPYVKLRYRKHWSLTDSTMIGVRPIVYWKTDDKFGTTLHVDFDHLLSDKWMTRWSNYGNVAQGEEVRGLEWESSLFLFQALTNRKALTYRAMVLGETNAPEPLVNYGVEVRYRQRMFREWLFLELITSLTWPKELIEEDRDANFGVGLGFEMYFGPVPDAQMY